MAQMGNTYAENFIGPLRPQDRRAPQGFIGPTLGPQQLRAPQGSVLGASTGPSSGGGSGDSRIAQLQKASRNPSQDAELQSLMQQNQPEQPSIDYDALIRPALDALEGSIAPLQQGFSDYQGQQQNVKQTQLAQNTQNVNDLTGQLETSRGQQQKSGESAIDEARRQYAEIQQGLQSRYGGTTGTGQFAGELAGGQTLRNIANIRTGLADAMRSIDDKLVQIKSIGDIQAKEIENTVQDRILQAKSNMDAQIADIRKQQGVLQSQKAQMAAEAIQQYQNSVNQFKSQQQQFLQQLYVQQTQAEQALNAAKQRGQQVVQSFSVQDLTGLAKQLSPAGLDFTATGKLGEGGTFQNPAFSISPTRTTAGPTDPFEEKLKKATALLGGQ